MCVVLWMTSNEHSINLTDSLIILISSSSLYKNKTNSDEILGHDVVK